jgi:hypothetical protein
MNERFYWIISQLIAQIIPRKSSFEIPWPQRRDVVSCFLKDVAKENSFPENILERK